MSLWWLEPGWADACCIQCGRRIAPEGDPDWGKCFECFSIELNARNEIEPPPQEDAHD